MFLYFKVKDQIHSNVGKTYPKLAAVNYKSQVVAGTNYFIKVDVGNDEHIHLKVYQALTHTGARPQLTSVQTGKSSVDAVEYF